MRKSVREEQLIMAINVKRRLPPKVNHYMFGVSVVVLLLAVIVGAQVLGWWSTSGRVDQKGAPVQLKGSDPAEIKGWMTLEQISTAYNIPVPEIIAAFQLPADTPGSTAIKDLEGVGVDFTTTNLRNWIGSELGIAVTTTGGTPKSGSGNKSESATPKAKP